MSLIPRQWVKWLAVVLGVAALLTPVLFDLGWIPQSQSQNVVIFLLGFIVLDGAARDSSEMGPVSELLTNTEAYFHTLGEWARGDKHEMIAVIHGDDILRDEVKAFLEAILDPQD